MTAIELLQKNPESSKLICKYYLEIMLASLNDDSLPEDFKEYVRKQGIDEDKIASIIDHNPRNVFDFFDDQKLFIGIIYDKDNGKFMTELNGESFLSGYSNRKEAEKDAVQDAIHMLETMLS